MKIYNLSDLISSTASWLFLDTAVFIYASKNEEEFADIFDKLKKKGCALITIPSVAFEFTRGSSSVSKFNERYGFLSEIATIWPIERQWDKLEKEIVILQKCLGKRKVSYTDFLLMLATITFRGSNLLTTNHHDITEVIFDRESMLTLDQGKDNPVNIVLYGINQKRYSRRKSNLL